MEIQVVEKQVHRNGVFQRNFHDGIVCGHLDGLALGRNFQILDDFKDIVANLLLGIAIHDGKARLLLHFVRELIVRYVGRDDFDRGINDEQQDRDENDRLELTRPAFGAAVRQRAANSTIFKMHWIRLPHGPSVPQRHGLGTAMRDSLLANASIRANECREIGTDHVPGEKRG